VLLSILQQLNHRQPRDRIDQARRYRGKRLEDEPALAESRMRNDQAGLVDDGVTEQYQIQIERSRRVDEGTRAAARALDREQLVENLARRPRRLPHRRGIQEERLVADDTDRFGFVIVRDAQIVEEGAKTGNGEVEMRAPVA
jgi:hypothetical protein